MNKTYNSRDTSFDHSAELRSIQLAWLAAAVFVVSAGYGALLPLLPGWLAPSMPGATAAAVARHVGLLSSVYAAGVLIGAPLWGVASDHVGRGRILIVGLVGYVASLLLQLVPTQADLWGLYALRGTTGFFVAAVVPVVSALVAEHTPEEKRARRFAWLGAMGLLGFLFGPGLTVTAGLFAAWFGEPAPSALLSAQIVIILSAFFGGVMMLGLAATLPALHTTGLSPHPQAPAAVQSHSSSLWWLNVIVMFILAGFELGLVLQGQPNSQSPRQASIMFAECSLVMLGINAMLFFTGLLARTSARKILCTGSILAIGGLAMLAANHSDAWMYGGVSLVSAGTGLVLPTIAFVAAGASRQTLGATMGGLAAAAGLGQTLGSAAGGWLFGNFAQRGFAWLMLPSALMLIILIARPRWCSVVPGDTVPRA